MPTNAKMSIVTADSDAIREQIKTANLRQSQVQRIFEEQDSFVMSRMNWLWALRPLFDSLMAFHCDSRKRHIEKANFLDALEKVKPTLGLKD